MKFKQLFMSLRSIGLSATQMGVRFAAYETKDGATLEIAGQMEVGSEVSITQEDGTLKPADNGEYALVSGAIVVVMDGKVADIKEGEPIAAEMAADGSGDGAVAPEAPTEPMSVTREEFDSLVSQVGQLGAMIEQVLTIVQADAMDDMTENTDMVEMKKTCMALEANLKAQGEIISQMAAVIPAKLSANTVERPVNLSETKKGFDPLAWAGAFSTKK